MLCRCSFLFYILLFIFIFFYLFFIEIWFGKFGIIIINNFSYFSHPCKAWHCAAAGYLRDADLIRNDVIMILGVKTHTHTHTQTLPPATHWQSIKTTTPQFLHVSTNTDANKRVAESERVNLSYCDWLEYERWHVKFYRYALPPNTHTKTHTHTQQHCQKTKSSRTFPNGKFC